MSLSLASRHVTGKLSGRQYRLLTSQLATRLVRVTTSRRRRRSDAAQRKLRCGQASTWSPACSCQLRLAVRTASIHCRATGNGRKAPTANRWRRSVAGAQQQRCLRGPACSAVPARASRPARHPRRPGRDAERERAVESRLLRGSFKTRWSSGFPSGRGALQRGARWGPRKTVSRKSSGQANIAVSRAGCYSARMTGKQFDIILKELGLHTRAAANALGLSPRSITTFATSKGKKVPRWLELAIKGLQVEQAENAGRLNAGRCATPPAPSASCARSLGRPRWPPPAPHRAARTGRRGEAWIAAARPSARQGCAATLKVPAPTKKVANATEREGAAAGSLPRRSRSLEREGKDNRRGPGLARGRCWRRGAARELLDLSRELAELLSGSVGHGLLRKGKSVWREISSVGAAPAVEKSSRPTVAIFRGTLTEPAVRQNRLFSATTSIRLY